MDKIFSVTRRQHCIMAPIVAAALFSGCSAPQTGEPQTGAATSPKTTTKDSAPKTPRVGDIAPDFELMNLQDEKIKLSAMAAKGPVVLVVLRGYPGYQCPICTVQVGQLFGQAKAFEKAKARVLLVYPGPSKELKKRADEFVKGKTLPANFDLILDPDYQFVNQYALRWDAPNETAYPSTFVLDNARKVRFAKVSKTHGDRAVIREIIAALP